MQTWYNVDWHDSLPKVWLLIPWSHVTDWLNCSLQLANYHSRSLRLKNCWARISDTKLADCILESLIYQNSAQTLLYYYFSYFEQIINISYLWELNDWMSITIFLGVKQIKNSFYVISLQVLTKKKQWRVYQDSRPPAPSDSKSNSKFEILIVKIFGLKQNNTKQIKYFQLLQKKSNFVSSRKQPYVASDYNF